MFYKRFTEQWTSLGIGQDTLWCPGFGWGADACRWTNFKPLTEYYHLEQKGYKKLTAVRRTFKVRLRLTFYGQQFVPRRDDASLRTAHSLVSMSETSFFCVCHICVVVMVCGMCAAQHFRLYLYVLSRLWSAVCRRNVMESSSRLCKKIEFFVTVYLSGYFFRSFLSKVFAECGLIEQLLLYIYIYKKRRDGNSNICCPFWISPVLYIGVYAFTFTIQIDS